MLIDGNDVAESVRSPSAAFPPHFLAPTRRITMRSLIEESDAFQVDIIEANWKARASACIPLHCIARRDSVDSMYLMLFGTCVT